MTSTAVVRREPVLGVALALLAVAAGVAWWLRRETAAERCARVSWEGILSATHQGPPPRPSDATWAAEHCWDGKLRP